MAQNKHVNPDLLTIQSKAEEEDEFYRSLGNSEAPIIETPEFPNYWTPEVKAPKINLLAALRLERGIENAKR